MIIRKILFQLSSFILALAVVPSALAMDSTSFEIGIGEHAQFVRLGLQSDWQSRWFQSNGSYVGAYTDFSLAQWRGMRFQGKNGARQTMTDVGLTPVLRFQSDSRLGLYAEAGIGAHLLSDLYDNNGRRFSTRFQFGDHLGLGYITQKHLVLSLQLQHFSNAGIKHPNPGELFVVLKMAHAF